jgi:chorismate mutase
LCMHEMDVPHGVKQCIRVLLHWNTEVAAPDVRHVYLKGAIPLRPDRAFSLNEMPGPPPAGG